MIPYEFLDHTADAKFRAYAANLEDAFANAAKATTAIMTPIEGVKPSSKKHIHLVAGKKQTLLYDFLEHLLFYLDTEGWLLSDVESLSIQEKGNDFILEADLVGDSGPQYEIHTHIKAITYSEMSIDESDSEVMIQVVVDI